MSRNTEEQNQVLGASRPLMDPFPAGLSCSHRSREWLDPDGSPEDCEHKGRWQRHTALHLPSSETCTKCAGSVEFLQCQTQEHLITFTSSIKIRCRHHPQDTSGSVTGERCSSMTELTPPQTSATKPNIMKESARGSAYQHISTQMQHTPCHYMDEKSIRHCQKMVYLRDARGRCSWRHLLGRRYWGTYWALLSAFTYLTFTQVLCAFLAVLPKGLLVALGCNQLLVNRGKCGKETCHRSSPGEQRHGNIMLPGWSSWCFHALKLASLLTPVYYSQSNQSETSAAFKGRIQNSKNIGNASLTIFNMQPQDTGIYTCEVFNPGDASGVAEKSVTVSVLGLTHGDCRVSFLLMLELQFSVQTNDSFQKKILYSP
ncbi:V-set and immunoglobulin domain-containing protein 1 [Varanus komodoensis]|nr:V-set and immunoglobulin domain-containing protein 1 [Varanus komodoensis]